MASKCSNQSTAAAQLIVSASSTARVVETSGEVKTRSEAINILNDARRAIVGLIIKHVKVLHNIDLTSDTNLLIKQISEPSPGAKALAIANKEKPRDLALPMHQISRKIQGSNAAKLAVELVSAIKADYSSVSAILADVVASGVYINFTLAMPYLGRVVAMIKDGSFLAPLSTKGRERVMIEYSQPNTHKAFHVGHMRNAALGDSLVRCFEQVGYPVVAANYFGDEGQHIATCLWQLDRETKAAGIDIQSMLASVPEVERGEWLGGFYSRGVESLALDGLTSQPYTGVVAAQVKSKDKHPAADAPANWHLVQVTYGSETATVVCGGSGYEVGDLVAYIPVGTNFGGKIIAPMDKKGIASQGVILAERELGIVENHVETNSPAATITQAPVCATAAEETDNKKGKETKTAPAAADDASPHKGNKGGKSDKGGKKEDQTDKKQKEKKEKPIDIVHTKIYVLNGLPGIKHGDVLTEFGRKAGAVPVGKTVDQEIKERVLAVKDVLLKMESRDAYWHPLWQQTAKWSFAEFSTIYKWLGSRFDKDFKESDVGEMSLAMVGQLYKDGKLDELQSADNSKPALGLDLEKRGFKGHGFCLLRKSNGSGLYATKDLSLAQVKFNDYKIDKSIYVVASEQLHHFKQVFKSLEVLGYEQAKKCYHLAYGMVRLPHGKMSSRKGTVIFFSTLKELLWSYFVKNLFRHRAYRQYSSQEFLDALLFTLPSGVPGWYKISIHKAINFIADQSMWSSAAVSSFAKLFDDTAGATTPKLWSKTEVSALVLGFTVPDEAGEKWSVDEVHDAVHALSVATIKYGMLNQNSMMDIVFDLESWAKHTGNTGPYLLMAYARMRAIIRNVSARSDINIKGVVSDFSLFEEADTIEEKDKLPQQRGLLLKINEFWPTLQDNVVKNYNPAQLCEYLSSLCREFSSWYEAVPYLTKEMNPTMLVTRLQLIEALSGVLKKGLALLGIPTLERL